MHTMTGRRPFAALSLTLTLALAAVMAVGQTAAPAAPAEKFDPTAAANAVAPFLDPAAIAVVRVEPAKINVDAIYNLVGQIYQAATPTSATAPGRIMEDAGFAKIRDVAKKWLADFAKAGGRDAYVVITLGEPSRYDIMFILVPLQAGADSQAITQLIGQFTPEVAAGTAPANYPAVSESRRFKPRIINNTLVLATPAMLEQLAALKPSPRPELAKAFAAAGEGMAQGIYIPTADTRKVLGEMLPATMPANMGGGPLAPVVRSTLWAAAGVNGPPNLSLKAVGQTTDPEAAKALAELVGKTLDGLAPYTPKDRISPEVLATVRAALKPTIQGDQVVIAPSPAQLETVIKSLPTLIDSLRKTAMHEVTGARLREIGLGIMQYTANHQDRFPPSLQTLVDEKYISAQALINPVQPQRRPGFVYLKPDPATMNNPNLKGTQMLVYEAFDEWPRDGVWVLFVASNRLKVTDQAEFRKLLADASGEKPK